jgi:putative addiction module component (TIGR02574 family)
LLSWRFDLSGLIGVARRAILLMVSGGGGKMTATVKSLGIDKMTRDQRLNLVQEIWNTIAAESQQSMLSDAQRQELERRIANDDANPDDLIPWEEIKAEALARLKQ